MSKWEDKSLFELGHTYNGLAGKSKSDFGHGSPFVTYTNVFKNAKVDFEDTDFVSIGKYEKQNAVRKGDVLFTTSSETPEEVGMASAVTEIPKENTFLNSFCFGFRFFEPNKFSHDFLAYAFRSDFFRHQMSIAAQGITRHNLSKKNFYASRIIFPEKIEEQTRIAEVLSTIDEAIDTTACIINKYRAMKSGLLHSLLLGSASKENCSQDSQWGLLPSSWVIKKIGDISTKVCSGATPKGGESVYQKSGTLFLRSQNVTHDGLALNDVAYINYATHKQMKRSQVHMDDILLNITGASIGRCVVFRLSEEANVNQHVCIIRLPEGNRLMVQYLYRWLTSNYGQSQIKRLMGGSNREGLSFAQIREIKVPLIQDEQELLNILEPLDAIDDKIVAEQLYLKKLLCIRAALMQDLLTQKVSVEPIM